MSRFALNERQGVTLGLFAFASLLLGMAWEDTNLWEVEVFKVVLQAVVLTGLLNMVAAFHFASSKGSETARENTGAAFRAIESVATGQSAPHGPIGTAEDPIQTEVVNSPVEPVPTTESKGE